MPALGDHIKVELDEALDVVFTFMETPRFAEYLLTLPDKLSEEEKKRLFSLPCKVTLNDDQFMKSSEGPGEAGGASAGEERLPVPSGVGEARTRH